MIPLNACDFSLALRMELIEFGYTIRLKSYDLAGNMYNVAATN